LTSGGDDAIVVVMAAKQSDRDHNGSDREDRIAALKQHADQIAGGKMLAWESEALSLDERERFWDRVVNYETAPRTTNFQQLIEAGIELPEPDSLNDEQLTAKMWEVIHALARIDVFIHFTDHLSDRELYGDLWGRVLREEVPDLPHGGWSEHVDLLNSTDPTHHIYLKYYANENVRRDWLVDFPDYDMPAHEDPPYDRDSRLPNGGW
jgi:hypothetical protein